MLPSEIKVQMLKTQQEYFISVADGIKKVELRLNDRDFKLGEYLMLGCFEGNLYMDRFIICKVTHIVSNFVGLMDNYVMLSIEKITGIVYDEWEIFEYDTMVK